jgi:hypothetical protein
VNRLEGLREIIASIGIFNLAWSDEENGVYSTDPKRPVLVKMKEGKEVVGKLFQSMNKEALAGKPRFPRGLVPFERLQIFYDSLPAG